MAKGKDRFDAVLASVPMNATAARVTSKGEHYEPKFNKARETWDEPPPMRPIPRDQQNNPQMKNIIGVKFGRFTVMGLYAPVTPASGASWVCRCTCGAYECRKLRSVRNPLNTDDRCSRCRHLLTIQKNYKRLGARPISDFTNKSQ